MLIIVEGPNGAGKTTVADRIARQLHNATRLHAVAPTARDAVGEYLAPLEDYLPAHGRHIVCDRWHLGEEVYGPLLRDGSRFQNGDFEAVDQALARAGAVLVPLLPPAETLIARRGDEDPPEQLIAERVLFHRVFQRTTLPKTPAWAAASVGHAFEMLATIGGVEWR